MQELFRQWTHYLASGIEASAAVLIGVAAVEALCRALLLFMRRSTLQQAKEEIRLQLGRWLALEFELAADGRE